MIFSILYPSSPIAITFFLYGQDKVVFENFLRNEIFNPRVALIPYYAERAKPYPINKLRNIAINSITTSHFWVADMDMWPASMTCSLRIEMI